MARRLLFIPCFIGTTSQVCLEVLEPHIVWKLLCLFFSLKTPGEVTPCCFVSSVTHSELLVSIFSEQTPIVMRRELFWLEL